MSADFEASYRHIRFTRTEIEFPRYNASRNIARPTKVNTSFGPQLRQQTDTLQHTFALETQAQPPEFDPALIFHLKLDGYVKPEEWERSSLTLLSDERDNAVVLFSEDQLAGFRQRIEAYSKEVGEGQKEPSYAWIASLTLDMQLWGPSQRTGQKLAAIPIDPTSLYRLDVELWQYGTDAQVRGRMDQLRAYVERVGGSLLDHFTGPSLAVARIAVPGEAIRELLNVEIIQTVDLPPTPDLTIGVSLNTPIDDFPAPVQHPPDNAPSICIVDSGINRGHPMLGPAIGDTIAVPSSIGDGLDEHGHGTMVAGIALYGDVRKCIDHLDFNPQLFLLSARVTNQDNHFDDDRLITTQMRDAIETLYRSYRCRVYNISLGDDELVYRGGRPSPWAQILDDLARELDVVIVVSAGNLRLAGMTGADADAVRTQYPGYLLDADSRIIEPATAANVLTVGALAHTTTAYAVARNPNDPAIRCVAAIDGPSPFTRCGPGVNGAIKPELCEYGGNLVWDGHGMGGRGRILAFDPWVGVVTTNRRHTERLFTTDVGTSLAAPRVAHLAAQILANYSDLSANLVRALIVNSASVPGPTECLFPNESELLKVAGYGQPNSNAALYSDENRVTLIAEDALPVGFIHLYEIPVPDEFKLARGERQITVSLAFDPPVRHTRRAYLGVRMGYRLYRGLSLQQIAAWYSTRQGVEEPAELPSRNQCNLRPGSTVRERGTIQKGVFCVQQDRALADYDGDVLHLVVQCRPGWLSAKEIDAQRYALAVTLDCSRGLVSLYNSVRQRVRLPQRVQLRDGI